MSDQFCLSLGKSFCVTNIVWFALLIARVDLLWSSKIDVGATPESSEMCLFPGSVRGILAYWPFFFS